MRGRSHRLNVAIALAAGFVVGGVTVGIVLIGPAGYRPLSATATAHARGQATPTPSPSSSGPGPTPASSARPDPRTEAAMAFDAATGRVVLFGGLVSTGAFHEFNHPLGDTWSWDGAHWTAVQLGSSPLARSDASMAYDATRRVVVMHGGFGGQQVINDTWTWDGARWIQMSPNQSPPAAGGGKPACWESQRGVVLLFDDVARGSNQPLSPGMNPEINQTWAWDGTNWSQLAGANDPSGHGAGMAGMACDAAGKSAVFFAHVNGRPTTWTFDGTTWKTQPSTAGSASSNVTMVTDAARATVVLFGENGDTWSWNGAGWTVQNPVHSPGPRSRPSMAYDSVHHVVVLFGGGTGQAAGYHELNDTWTWNGSDWTEVSTAA